MVSNSLCLSRRSRSPKAAFDEVALWTYRATHSVWQRRMHCSKNIQKRVYRLISPTSGRGLSSQSSVFCLTLTRDDCHSSIDMEREDLACMANHRRRYDVLPCWSRVQGMDDGTHCHWRSCVEPAFLALMLATSAIFPSGGALDDQS